MARGTWVAPRHRSHSSGQIKNLRIPPGTNCMLAGRLFHSTNSSKTVLQVPKIKSITTTQEFITSSSSSTPHGSLLLFQSALPRDPRPFLTGVPPSSPGLPSVSIYPFCRRRQHIYTAILWSIPVDWLGEKEAQPYPIIQGSWSWALKGTEDRVQGASLQATNSLGTPPFL